VQPVAAFEVADASLDPGAIAGSAFAGATAAGFVAPGDLDLVLCELVRCLVSSRFTAGLPGA
jgi:hypothetical protein